MILNIILKGRTFDFHILTLHEDFSWFSLNFGLIFVENVRDIFFLLENTSDEKPEIINRKEDSITNSPTAEQVAPLNATDTRTSSVMPEAAGPIMVELGNHNQANENMIDYITPKEFKKMLKRKEDVHLIDLRETWEINNAGKVKNSIHIPCKYHPPRSNGQVEDQSTHIIVIHVSIT